MHVRPSNVYLDASEPDVFNSDGKTKAARRKPFLTDVAAAVLQKKSEKVTGIHFSHGLGVNERPIIKVNNAHPATLERAESIRASANPKFYVARFL
jgi:hypothetical protein